MSLITQISLADAVEFVVDNRGKTAPTQEVGIPLIATNCISNDLLYPTKDRPRFVSQETYDNWFRAHPKPGDIILTNKGSQNGAVCLVPDPVNFCIAQDMVALRADPNKIDPLYLFAALRSSIVQERIKALNVDAVIPHFKKTDFNKLFIPLPERKNQEFIGKLYFNQSSKIELNRQISQTLEQIAQTFFKSWFVDFEPVKAKIEAKAAGRDPERAAMCAISGKDEAELDHLPPEHYQQLAATAALFPDELVESELGLIPAGWEVKALDQIADYLNGLALQKYPPESGSNFLPVIKIAQLKKGDTEGADRASSKLKAEYIVNDGDVLFSWSGSLEVDVWCGGPGALNQHLFKVTSAYYPKWFYYHWTKTHLSHFQGVAADKAVTMGHIQRKHLTTALCFVPPDFIMKKLDKFIAPLLAQQIQLRKESRSITALRDSLLPKLLSGELSI